MEHQKIQEADFLSVGQLVRGDAEDRSKELKKLYSLISPIRERNCFFTRPRQKQELMLVEVKVLGMKNQACFDLGAF